MIIELLVEAIYTPLGRLLVANESNELIATSSTLGLETCPRSRIRRSAARC
jgi:hypothetical protein